ncbi:HD domain-containing protein [Mesonia aestuariivivens]|uniref:HD domain-containing protein n=1 Tax=Mesonia aestuariivivens TaxID=2796128 RepID=A0ABS6W1U0_9FLAO|nr:HD domain-containing protein [Mesonia aestuariivivens]MBW2961123.1 HD domain-containing protein [Mesonia aestuariivivens]
MNALLEKTKTHCQQLLSESRCKELAFHNSQHTKEVFNSAKKIGAYVNLSEEELEIVLLAALFHDTGNMDCFKNHESVSAQKASDYLNEIGFEPSKIEKVIKCILATKMPQSPTNILEEVICDADLAHLGEESFISKNGLLRKEWSEHLKICFSNKEWVKLNIDFLECHRYFTPYGKKLLLPQKKKNLKILKQQFSEIY